MSYSLAPDAGAVGKGKTSTSDERGSLRKRLAGAEAVEYVRAVAGAAAVIVGDVVIAVAAGTVLVVTGATSETIVTVLTGAFTAISTMTAAYFGIKAASNTAQNATAMLDRQLSMGGGPSQAPSNVEPAAG